MATTYSTPFMQKPDSGFRLGDIRAIWDGMVNNNAISQAYGIAAAGTTRATATPLTAVLNQIDTVSASTGVNLPLSTGARTTPFSLCLVINNGASTLTVYGAQTGSDTINGTSGATGVSQPAGVAVLYASAKGGAWFTLLSGQNAAFGALTATSIVNSGSTTTAGVSSSDNFTETAVGKGFVQKSNALGTARAGTFTLVGASNVTVTCTTITTSDFIGISLNTPTGTVGAMPTIQTIQVGTSFVVKGTASDSSTYNWSMIGVN